MGRLTGAGPAMPARRQAKPTPQLKKPRVRDVPQEEDPLQLIPRDPSTLQRLLYSAHAHCDLSHRLGEFRVSRALARLLHSLKAYHRLPLLDTGRLFGGIRV